MFQPAVIHAHKTCEGYHVYVIGFASHQSVQARQCVPVSAVMLPGFDFTLHVQDMTCELRSWILAGSKLMRLAVQVH